VEHEPTNRKAFSAIESNHDPRKEDSADTKKTVSLLFGDVERTLSAD
jgi:hypothetical protein